MTRQNYEVLNSYDGNIVVETDRLIACIRVDEVSPRDRLAWGVLRGGRGPATPTLAFTPYLPDEELAAFGLEACPDCNGEGSIEVLDAAACRRPISECCGGCSHEEACGKCDGAKVIPRTCPECDAVGYPATPGGCLACVPLT